jgi:hypothetical protein
MSCRRTSVRSAMLPCSSSKRSGAEENVPSDMDFAGFAAADPDSVVYAMRMRHIPYLRLDWLC